MARSRIDVSIVAFLAMPPPRPVGWCPARGFAPVSRRLGGDVSRHVRDQTTVQIPEWGADCGPRPASHTGASGRSATVTSNGQQLSIEDGRRHNRTSGCWSDNPEVHPISQSHSGMRWTVICQTPDANYQHEQGTYTITADSGHITMREQSEYSWQLRASRCHATASRSLVYELVQSAAPPDCRSGRRGAAAPEVHNTPPPNRCATPGPAASLQIVPSRRSLTPGGRTCFHARYLDANRCEVTGGAVSWQLTRSTGAASSQDAVMENGCVRAPGSAVEVEYAVAATGGGLSDRAVAAVVSAQEMESLVASHIEDEDAGALPMPTSAASGSGVGVGVVVNVPAATRSSTGPGWTVWLLIVARRSCSAVAAQCFLLAGPCPPKSPHIRRFLNPRSTRLRFRAGSAVTPFPSQRESSR